MLDHLTKERRRPGARTATGLAVSLALHGSLIALLVYGIGTAATSNEGGAGERDRIPAASTTGESGIGGPIEIARFSTPTVDLRHAALASAGSTRIPDTLELGRAVPIRFYLPAERIAPDSLLDLKTAAGAPISVALSHTRLATLQGGRFLVEPLTPALQVTNPVRPTEWLWNVTPTEVGAQALTLRVDAIARVDGAERVVTLATLPGEVVVSATAIQRTSTFFSHHWTWLSLLVVVALAGWLRATLDRRALY